MTPSPWEFAARAWENGPRYERPGDLATAIDSRTVQTPALDLIDDALVKLASTPDARLIISMPPQEGKSVRAGIVFPIWMLHRRPETRVVVASYGQALAIRNGRAIRNRVTSSPQLGMRIATDNGAVHDWTLAGHEGGVLSVGIGSGLTGRPADLLVIDDPIKDRKEADSLTYRNAVWDWWTDVASARLAPGAPVVLILTRWHEDDLAGRLLKDDEHGEWQVINIPAQADHDPAKGETDVLGREPGEFMKSARRRTTAQWERRKRTAGSRTWASLYQGRPSPADGDVWLRQWWRYYESPQWVERPDGSRWIPGAEQVVASWDMAFKETSSSDYVACFVLARRGADVFVVDRYKERADFTETLRQVKAMAGRWPQAVAKLVEDKANGTAVINALSRTVPGLIPVEPDGSKHARAAAVAPFIEAGNVWLPDPTIPGCAWASDLVEEGAAFPNGAHDDQVDALSQGLNRLLLAPLLDGDVLFEPDEFDDALISPY